MELTTRPLEPATWDPFAALVEANNGVWGGCWCMGFHGDPPGIDHRIQKLARVQAGTTHSALVFDGPDDDAACLGWCQFGPTDELPQIKHQKAYFADRRAEPDWRITCFFVGKGLRKRGVAAAALAGALEQIAALGGGLVESYPEDTEGRSAAGAFLFNGTLAMFEAHGFERQRKIGKHKWVVTKRI